MNVTILTHVESEGSRKLDPVIGQVAEALTQGGHKVSTLAVHGDVRKLIAGLNRRKPDLIFNLMEMFGRDIRGDVAVAGLLELLGVPYTGGGPGELFLRQDKALAKRLLAFEGLQYPDFAVISPDGLETGGNLRMPLFVKPLRADASIGISGAKSLVRDAGALMRQVTAIHKDLDDAAIAEEYVEGREFYVGVLGNREPVAFPPIEMDFSGMPEGAPHVLDQKAKFAEGTPEYEGTKAVLPRLPDQLAARLRQVALDAARALRVRDYGRVDLRVSPTGEIYVIEVNANCYLERSGEFATAAEAHGLPYPDLINRIAELAVERSS
jgi:D-alanine-D-alanine ligase